MPLLPRHPGVIRVTFRHGWEVGTGAPGRHIEIAAERNQVIQSSPSLDERARAKCAAVTCRALKQRDARRTPARPSSSSGSTSLSVTRASPSSCPIALIGQARRWSTIAPAGG